MVLNLYHYQESTFILQNKAEVHGLLYLRRTAWQRITKPIDARKPVEQETLKSGAQHRT